MSLIRTHWSPGAYTIYKKLDLSSFFDTPMIPTSTAPALFSVPRITTLLVSLLVSLSSGSNYAYSAYAPQMGARLHISHTQLNIIGLAGNAGVYISGPVWGKTVDGRGPRILLAGAFFLLLIGYMGIRYIFNAGIPFPDDPKDSLSTFRLVLLVLFGCMTGSGGSAGLMASVNTAAKSFPDRARATTTGIVFSGFGLSALVFSTIAHIAFPGDTSSFLLLLALGASLPMILGFFIVRPIPLPASEMTHTLENGFTEDHIYHRTSVGTGIETPIVSQRETSRTPLLAYDDVAADEPELQATAALPYVPPHAPRAVELGRRSRRDSVRTPDAPNIYGKQMFMMADFWMLFSIMTLLTGTGLMWINNVGSISQALYAKGNPGYDETIAAQWQAAQVSTVSLTNFLGRIVLGLLSDYVKNRLHRPRSYCVCVVAFLFIVSQVIAARVDDVKDLWAASAMLGLTYGGLFTVFPNVSLEWFGMAHFSENWGYLSMSPLIGGNVFSIAFGRNLDEHAAPEPSSLTRRAGLPSLHQCFDGRDCYVTSLYMTVVACTCAFLLSLWAARRDRRRVLAKMSGEDGED